DDFGDLYADVEVQATSAINTAPQSSNPQCVTNETGNQNNSNDLACVSVDNDEIEDEDDDDDDLDIVLNSDDDGIKPGEGFVTANVQNREFEDEDDDNLHPRSQTVAYGSDLKGVGCVSVAYWQQLGSRSVGAQAAQRFSLPRARNILDVNIDVFEQKPWKHPGADITDYFNFGFNEDSWKLYCNQVDEYRHRGPVSSGAPPSEPAQSTEVETRKGQAIQVEDSIFERQSSMDVWRQLDRDSDAIQITILDPEDTSVPEASNPGDVSGDDVTDHLSFSSASEDDSVEEKYIETDIYPPKLRSGSEDREIHEVVTDETIRTSNDTKVSNLVEESSEAEKKPANRYKSFEDDACFDRRKVYTRDRCLTELGRSVKPDYHHSEDLNKLVNKRGHDENRYHARRLGDNRKYGDCIYRERSNGPVYKNKTHTDLNMKTHHENDYINSRTYDKRRSDECRYHARHNNDLFHMSDDDVHSTFRRRLHAFDPYEENISYSKSEVRSDYYGERLCGYEDWDAERCETNMDRTVFKSSADDEYYDERRSHIEDNKLIEGDWCEYEKGRKKGEKLYSRNKGETDEFYLDSGYYDDTHGGSFRSVTHNDRKRDDIEYTRWEFRSPGRNTRRVCSLFSESDNPLVKNNEQAFASRYEQSFASRSSEESNINNCRWDGNRMPKSSFYRRHDSYRGQRVEPIDRDDMFDIDGRLNIRRKKCHWQSEIEWEDEIMYRHEDSYPFGEVSRRKRIVSEPDPDYDHVEMLVGDPYIFDGSSYVKELTDGQLAKGCKYYNQNNNEVFNGYKRGKQYEKSRERLPLISRNSHLVAGKVKSSKKHKKPKWMDLNTCNNVKVARADDTRAVDGVLDIQKGQAVTEVKVGPMNKTRAHVYGSHNQNGKSGFDNTRILEAMAKMEKRRARFNEPVAITKMDSDSSLKHTVVGQAQETGSNKQQRPARKRRWGQATK
ncbi:hypothetical protein M8C21_005645, partial [Ambrosia artemisiifolia]